MSAGRDEYRPPKFREFEAVRVLSATGMGTDDLHNSVDGAGIVGDEVSVSGACPKPDGNGWLIAVSGEATEGWRWWFSESSLESTGSSIEFEFDELEPWKDAVELEFETLVEVEDPDEYPPQHELHDIVERTQTALHERLEIADLDVWTTDGETGNYGFVLTLYPAGNVVAGCERTDASPERAWMHGEESHEFPVSEWMPPHGERLVFLTEGIESAKVTCWRWSTPARVTGR